MNPDALAIADALDAERKAGKVRGPLHGIPVAHQGQHRHRRPHDDHRRSLALEGSIAPRDAFVVERLRAAGAVILGKTNLSEWANFRSTKSTSGWSGRGGQVAESRTCSTAIPAARARARGAAVAANLAAAGVGTETDGSIVCPVGRQRPGRDQADGRPGQPRRHHPDLAHAGHRGPDGADGRRRGGAAGRDGGRRIPRDTRDDGDARARRHRTTSKALDAGALKGARIGVAAQALLRLQPGTDALIEAAIAALKAQGATIVDPADIPTAARLDDCEFEILLFEFKAGLNAYLAGRGPAPAGALARRI